MSVNKVQLANGETIIDISDSTVTPETLAEGVTAHDASGQKITGKMDPGGGSSVQSDWNQTDSSAADFIKNKPFGDMPTGGDTLYWDGNTEGLVNFEGLLHKVSNAVPTKADFANGCIYQFKHIGFDDVNDIAFTAEEAQSMFLDDGAAYFQGFAVIPFDNYEAEGLLFREAGVYLAADDSMYVSFLTIPGYTGFPVTKKIEQKYLPGAVILYADEENYLYATADTSDTSKRMTRAELTDAVYSGRMVYCFLDGAAYCALLNFVDAVEFAIANFDDGEGKQTFFTAEYVSE